MSMVTYSTMTGVQGEFYPCDADVFATTYEAVEL